MLGAFLELHNISPFEARSLEPPLDPGWVRNGIVYLAEVKSIARENEERQLRLALGQILRYCHLTRGQANRIVPVLAPELERRPIQSGMICVGRKVSHWPFLLSLLG